MDSKAVIIEKQWAKVVNFQCESDGSEGTKAHVCVRRRTTSCHGDNVMEVVR